MYNGNFQPNKAQLPAPWTTSTDITAGEPTTDPTGPEGESQGGTPFQTFPSSPRVKVGKEQTGKESKP